MQPTQLPPERPRSKELTDQDLEQIQAGGKANVIVVPVYGVRPLYGPRRGFFLFAW